MHTIMLHICPKTLKAVLIYRANPCTYEIISIFAFHKMSFIGSRALTWLIPYRIPSVFPSVNYTYNCTPHPVPFNITLSGQFETTGLKLQHSKNYSCQSKDISGMLKLELIVQGLRPLRPKIIFTRIFDRESQFFYIEWTNVATQLRPVQRYVLSWRVTTGGGGTVVDKRQFHANNHTVTTPNNYYHLSYRRNEVFTLTVHATNEAGDGPESSQWVFDVNKEDGASTGNRPASFPLWLIILIIAIGLLLCCICCICCLLCFCCCCCGKRRDYPAEERGEIIVHSSIACLLQAVACTSQHHHH